MRPLAAASDAPPAAALSGSPFGQALRLDLGTGEGMALLRQFDARLRRLGEAAQRAAVRELACRLPLAERASGLLVLPGGALALRRGGEVLVAEAGSAQGVQGATLAALWPVLARLPGVSSVLHGPHGLCHRPGLPPAAAAQAMTLLPRGAALAELLPAARGWEGPALLRWCPGGAVAWRLAPAPAELALGASIAGEALPMAGAALPAEAWDLPEGDDRFPLFSSGLFAHLDELLGNEVSDRLRYAMIACWTDGEDCLASRLADAVGLLPGGFATPWDRPGGLSALAQWPRAAALAADWAEGGALLLGLAAADWGAAWRPGRRHAALRAARPLLAADPAALLVPEAAGRGPYALRLLGADREMRAGDGDVALLAGLGPVAPEPAAALRLARRLARAAEAPVRLLVPCWGLSQLCLPGEGGAEGLGNAAWYGG